MAMDESGDGQSSSTSGVSQGSIKVTDAAGFELLDISGNWGGYQSVTFEVTYGLELDELVEAKRNCLSESYLCKCKCCNHFSKVRRCET